MSAGQSNRPPTLCVNTMASGQISLLNWLDDWFNHLYDGLVNTFQYPVTVSFLSLFYPEVLASVDQLPSINLKSVDLNISTTK